MYEQENYLRYYIELALTYWRHIAAAVVVAGAIAFIFTISQDRVYEAQATVAMLRSRTDVELDPRIQTLSGQEVSGSSATAREEGLLALTKSNEVTQRVLGEVSDLLEADARKLSALRDMAEAGVEGDLVNITVRHSDPEVATAIANAWAQSYEAYVNSIYTNAALNLGSDTEAQVESARQNYDEAQAALEAFIAEDPLLTLEREIAVRQALLDGYQQTLIDMRVKPVATDQAILSDYYVELQQIDGWLADARSLLEQVQNNSNSAASNMGDAVAFVLLQGKVSSSERPTSVQPPTTASGSETGSSSGDIYIGGNSNPMALQVDVSGALTEGVSAGDVNGLIETLESRREATAERISTLQASINGSETSEIAAVADFSQLEGRITAIEEEISRLQSEVEAQTALRQELEQARDRNWDTYQVLLSRQAEEEIATGSPGAEVRIADMAVVPTEPVGRGVVRNTLLAATVALMFAIGVILLVDWWSWDPSAVGESERVRQRPMSDGAADNVEVERAAEEAPGSRQLSNRTT